MSDLTSPLLILPRLQAATLASRWQANIVHLEQTFCLGVEVSADEQKTKLPTCASNLQLIIQKTKRKYS